MFRHGGAYGRQRHLTLFQHHQIYEGYLNLVGCHGVIMKDLSEPCIYQRTVNFFTS